MFKHLQTWYRNRKDQQTCPPRPRIIPSLEALEERWCLAGDTYTWNPGNVNLLGSNSANWMKNGVQQGANGTLPGNNANDTVVLDGNVSSKDIEWDKASPFSTMTLQNTYLGKQTIDKNVTLEVTGDNGSGAVNCSKQFLTISTADSTGKLKIDNNSTIAAFSFTGAGTMLIGGGKTNACTGTVNGTCDLWGILQIQDATLVDQGKNQINLLGMGQGIQIYSANLEVGGGAAKTLISEFAAGSNDYIDVENSGLLTYLGKAGVTDTFTAPVLVEQGGTFTADGGGGGTLTINGAEKGTNNVSLYVSGTLQLKNTITLNTGAGMQAPAGSNIMTMDSTTDTITVASGSPAVVDGYLQIDTDTGTYGTLVVNADTLDFGGSLFINLDSNSGHCDQLIVNGTLDLDSNTSVLYDSLIGNGTGPETYLVIDASGGISGSFSYIEPVYGVYYQGYNYPLYGEFVLYFNNY